FSDPYRGDSLFDDQSDTEASDARYSTVEREASGIYDSYDGSSYDGSRSFSVDDHNLFRHTDGNGRRGGKKAFVVPGLALTSARMVFDDETVSTARRHVSPTQSRRGSVAAQGERRSSLSRASVSRRGSVSERVVRGRLGELGDLEASPSSNDEFQEPSSSPDMGGIFAFQPDSPIVRPDTLPDVCALTEAEQDFLNPSVAPKHSPHMQYVMSLDVPTADGQGDIPPEGERADRDAESDRSPTHSPPRLAQGLYGGPSPAVLAGFNHRERERQRVPQSPGRFDLAPTTTPLAARVDAHKAEFGRASHSGGSLGERQRQGMQEREVSREGVPVLQRERSALDVSVIDTDQGEGERIHLERGSRPGSSRAGSRVSTRPSSAKSRPGSSAGAARSGRESVVLKVPVVAQVSLSDSEDAGPPNTVMHLDRGGKK
ncbi:hypothetical protein KIPB_009703, partial [Kipferlia bialata]